MKKYKTYLAGGLFNAAERFHNLQLEKYLSCRGFDVLLPQREADKWIYPDSIDLENISQECRNMAADPNNILVGCIDGADADSGTCVEYGIAMQSTGRAVVYRTDFRTAPEKEVGLNAMLTLPGSKLVYFPCFAINLSELDGYYKELSGRIVEALNGLL